MSPGLTVTMDELSQRGIQLFNNREYFKCHEVLEEAWTGEVGAAATFSASSHSPCGRILS